MRTACGPPVPSTISKASVESLSTTHARAVYHCSRGRCNGP